MFDCKSHEAKSASSQTKVKEPRACIEMKSYWNTCVGSMAPGWERCSLQLCSALLKEPANTARLLWTIGNRDERIRQRKDAAMPRRGTKCARTEPHVQVSAGVSPWKTFSKKFNALGCVGDSGLTVGTCSEFSSTCCLGLAKRAFPAVVWSSVGPIQLWQVSAVEAADALSKHHSSSPWGARFFFTCAHLHANRTTWYGFITYDGLIRPAQTLGPPVSQSSENHFTLCNCKCCNFHSGKIHQKRLPAACSTL